MNSCKGFSVWGVGINCDNNDCSGCVGKNCWIGCCNCCRFDRSDWFGSWLVRGINDWLNCCELLFFCISGNGINICFCGLEWVGYEFLMWLLKMWIFLLFFLFFGFIFVGKWGVLGFCRLLKVSCVLCEDNFCLMKVVFGLFFVLWCFGYILCLYFLVLDGMNFDLVGIKGFFVGVIFFIGLDGFVINFDWVGRKGFIVVGVVGIILDCVGIMIGELEGFFFLLIFVCGWINLICVGLILGLVFVLCWFFGVVGIGVEGFVFKGVFVGFKGFLNIFLSGEKICVGRSLVLVFVKYLKFGVCLFVFFDFVNSRFDVDEMYFGVLRFCGFIMDFCLRLEGDFSKDIKRVFWILCCIFGESLFVLLFLRISLSKGEEEFLFKVLWLGSNGDECSVIGDDFRKVFVEDGFFLLILNGVLKIDNWG